MLEPLPIELPLPQPPAYHLIDDPVPREPPDTLSDVLPPLHIVVLPVIEVGAEEDALIVTVWLEQPDQHPPLFAL